MSKPVVLITGALSGIGRAAAVAFANEGAHVVVSGRRDDAGNALAAELRGLGAEAEFVRTDVRHEDDVRHLVDQAVARFGRLDIAVSNAGTEGKPGPLIEFTAESYAAMFDTNVLGTLFTMKHALRVMQAQGSGSVVNVSSTMGARGAANMSLYAGSKHAVEGITNPPPSRLRPSACGSMRWRRDRRRPPCSIAWPARPKKKAAFSAAIPLKRAGTPEEVADAIIFLASDKARFITGQIIRINGGKTAS